MNKTQRPKRHILLVSKETLLFALPAGRQGQAGISRERQ